MEVHHPHHPSHKKKWTEYLLEFLMLFLAVFLGFIAENTREHIVERNRAKELKSALINDLQKDSSQVRILRTYRNKRKLDIDSLYGFLNEPFEQTDRASFYRVVKKVQAIQNFSPSTGTINELKNAGYLRYFIHTNLATLLAEYEAICVDCSMDEKIENDHLYQRFYGILLKVADPASLDSLFNRPLEIHGKGITPINKEDLGEMQKVISMIRYQNTVFIRPNGQFDKLKSKESEIIDHLNNNFR